MSLFNNKCYKCGKCGENPEKLVVFVHGYNGSPEAIHYAIQWLNEKLDDAVIVVPRAPYPCEKDGENLQWLSFFKSDPEIKFRNPATPTEEIFEIFNRLGDDFSKTAAQMNAFIDEQQRLWHVSDENTYLMGFSQGAMISIYTALSRRQKLGGCVSVAGIIAGKDKLATEIVSRPPFLLLHGKDDTTVQYKTVPDTLHWLKKHQIDFEFFDFDNLAHRMSEAEMQMAADFINGKK